MIQKIQKLKAKKGFTLVELIVVIAIIGVLAAILVPTMLNFVTQANVSSANSTAASIKSQVDAWLTKLDTKGKGMKLSDSATDTFFVTIDDAKKWTTTAPATAASWNRDATTFGDADKDNDNPEVYLKPLFPDMKNASFMVYLQGGKCIAVAYVPVKVAQTVITKAVGATADVLFDDTTPTWVYTEAKEKFSKTEGVLDSGEIIGTAPAIVK